MITRIIFKDNLKELQANLITVAWEERVYKWKTIGSLPQL